MHDLIIVGASAAGCSASVYAARAKMHFLLVAKDVGGEVASSGEIENWPGVNHTTGVELAEQFSKQLTHNHVEPEVSVEIQKIEKTGDTFVLTGLKDGSDPVQYEARTVLFATGVHPRHLNVPGEDTFYLKGVSYCTTCDGPLFKQKVVTTIGGGNSANESGIMMSGIASKVYVLTKNSDMQGEKTLIENLKSKSNVTIIPGATTTEIVGSTHVTGVKYTDASGTEQLLPTDGVFIHIGLIPNSSAVKDLVALDALGNVVIDAVGASSVPGLYAAGDVTNHPYKQIAIAAGQGVSGVLAIQSYLNSH
ncbi:MAG: FAD-dependent oxidoreductase [Candidatus Kerfeldbacteria bacterium]|nr:FAD-dependent oxidoreductase [Candidatus Kerfeldbacteria bacterium]